MQLSCRLDKNEEKALLLIQNAMRFWGASVSKSDGVRMALVTVAKQIREGKLEFIHSWPKEESSEESATVSLTLRSTTGPVPVK